jgi:hypothetical protein
MSTPAIAIVAADRCEAGESYAGRRTGLPQRVDTWVKRLVEGVSFPEIVTDTTLPLATSARGAGTRCRHQ